MFEALGHLVVRRRWLTLGLFAVGLVVAGVVGSGLFSRLAGGGFDDPGSDSAAAAHALQTSFGVRDPVAVLAVRTPAGVDQDADAATGLVQRLAEEDGVEYVVSYWTSGRPAALKGADGRTGQVLVYATSSDAAARADIGKRIVAGYDGTRDGLRIFVGGPQPVNTAVNDRITADLGRAESIAIPITVILLVVVFGSLVAAGLPGLVEVRPTGDLLQRDHVRTEIRQNMSHHLLPPLPVRVRQRQQISVITRNRSDMYSVSLRRTSRL